MKSQWLEPDVSKDTSPVLRGGRLGNKFFLTRPIAAIFDTIRYKAKHVLDADIAKCFDRIDQGKLLQKLNTFPTMRLQIKSWLKAGVMDGNELFPTSEGTPQGGVISPLLANIALHGMENRIKQYVGSLKHLDKIKRNRQDSVSLIRYADDFVVLHKDITVVQGCQKIISDWLNDMGLELKPSKTRLAHTLDGDKPGFDFLGFNIHQFSVGKYHLGKNPQGQLLGFKTIITPSKSKQKIHSGKIAKVISSHKAAPQSV